MSAQWEVVYGYCFNKDGSYGNPATLASGDDMLKFIANNVERSYELRIVDVLDLTVFHVVDQSLVFPLPEHGLKLNKWDRERQMFINLPQSSTHVQGDACEN